MNFFQRETFSHKIFLTPKFPNLRYCGHLAVLRDLMGNSLLGLLVLFFESQLQPLMLQGTYEMCGYPPLPAFPEVFVVMDNC